MSWMISKVLMEDYENSRSLQALAEESSEESCSDGKQSAQSSETLMLLAYCAQDRMTEFSRLSRYGVTFAPLTESLGEELLTWFLGGSLVRTYRQPETDQGLMASDLDCGEKWPELSARYDLYSHLWKTHLCLFQEDLPWSSVILPKWGMSANGYVWQHPKLERPIRGIASGLLPTPSGVNGGRNNVMGRIDEWGGSGNPFRGTEIGRVRCANFEEWMMGWPMGWSALTPLETGKFLSWQQQHSANY